MKYCISKHKYHVCISVLMHYDSFKKKIGRGRKLKLWQHQLTPKLLAADKDCQHISRCKRLLTWTLIAFVIVSEAMG